MTIHRSASLRSVPMHSILITLIMYRSLTTIAFQIRFIVGRISLDTLKYFEQRYCIYKNISLAISLIRPWRTNIVELQFFISVTVCLMFHKLWKDIHKSTNCTKKTRFTEFDYCLFKKNKSEEKFWNSSDKHVLNMKNADRFETCFSLDVIHRKVKNQPFGYFCRFNPTPANRSIVVFWKDS